MRRPLSRNRRSDSSQDENADLVCAATSSLHEVNRAVACSAGITRPERPFDADIGQVYSSRRLHLQGSEASPSEGWRLSFARSPARTESKKDGLITQPVSACQKECSQRVHLTLSESFRLFA